MTTVKSFAALANAWGIKVKHKDKKKVMKCPNCGGHLRQLDNSNVWVCDYSKLEEKVDKNGETVQVFTPCNQFVLSSV